MQEALSTFRKRFVSFLWAAETRGGKPTSLHRANTALTERAITSNLTINCTVSILVKLMYVSQKRNTESVPCSSRVRWEGGFIYGAYVQICCSR